MGLTIRRATSPAPKRGLDRDLLGALGYGAGLAAAGLLIYAFNAIVARRLTPEQFGTFGAFLGVLLALSGPVTALLGGAAMVSARTGTVPRPRWRMHVLVLAAAAAAAGSLPIPPNAKAASWFAVAVAMSLLVGWNRGLLIGLGRLGTVGATLAFEGVARIGFMLILLHAGRGLPGASAGLALGIGSAALATEFLIPRPTTSGTAQIDFRALASIAGLFLLGVAQFSDVIAVRVLDPHGAGAYAVASSVARLALYVQAPAAAYALRRSAVAGARQALRWAVALSLLPGLVVTIVLEIAPRVVLARSFGSRYASAVDLVRVLTPAMLLAGASVMLIHLMMGRGRTAWVWSMAVVSTLGVAAIFAAAVVPLHAAIAVLVIQTVTLMVAAVHARRLLTASAPAQGAILFLNWRDTRSVLGGGSEVFVEEVAALLAASGRPVTVFCAAHADAPRGEVRNGVRFIRRGSWRTVYAWAPIYHLLGRLGPHEVVVDVQNGIPFFSPLYCGRPVVVLVHHVHREQWGMVFGPRLARLGWRLESSLAPRIYRSSTYVAVSEATKSELVGLGVDMERISVISGGNVEPSITPAVPKAARPTIVFLGRLVQSKRIELLCEAATELRPQFPGLCVRIMGRGLWEQRLRTAVSELGLDDVVRFEGFTDEPTKLRILAESWVLALPSVKEGWGLVVIEAAAMGTPSVAFRVGGLQESIVDGTTGLLARDYPQFVGALRSLLCSPELRGRLGAAARTRAGQFTWVATARSFERVVERAKSRGAELRSATELLAAPALE